MASPFKKRPHKDSEDEFEELKAVKKLSSQSSINEKSIEDLSLTEIASPGLKEGKILLTGLVLKKCGWIFYKPRQLIFKEIGKLYYYDPTTGQLKVCIYRFDDLLKKINFFFSFFQ